MSAILENFPAIRPALLLDFANSGRVDPRISCVRGSTASGIGHDGKMRTIAAHVPRIDYDPLTGKCLGLLVEEARANIALYSESIRVMSGAWSATRATMEVVAGASAPLGLSGVSKVTPDGTGQSYVSCLTATGPAGSPLSATIFVKSAGATTVQLDFIATGFSNIRCLINLTTGAYATGGGGGARVRSLRDGWYEVSIFGSFTGSDFSSFRVTVTDSNPTAANAFFLTGAQIERGEFPTSYIPTTTSAIARAADVVTLSGASLAGIYNNAEGVILCEYQLGLKNLSLGVLHLSKTGAAATDSMSLRYSSGKAAQYQLVVNGFGVVSIAPLGYANPGIYRRAITYGTDRFAQAINGEMSSSTVLLGTPNMQLDVCAIGSESALNQLCGHIRNIAFFSKSMTDAQLKRITA